jgi:hypothetical protein
VKRFQAWTCCCDAHRRNSPRHCPSAEARRGGWGGWGWGVGAFAAGAVIGGALAAPYSGYYGYAPRYAYAPGYS